MVEHYAATEEVTIETINDPDSPINVQTADPEGPVIVPVCPDEPKQHLPLASVDLSDTREENIQGYIDKFAASVSSNRLPQAIGLPTILGSEHVERSPFLTEKNRRPLRQFRCVRKVTMRCLVLQQQLRPRLTQQNC